MDEFTEIATKDKWRLILQNGRENKEWQSIKLEHSEGFRKKEGRTPKRNWWFGWDGERLSRNHDSYLLEQYHPDIATWVMEELRKTPDSARSGAEKGVK